MLARERRPNAGSSLTHARGAHLLRPLLLVALAAACTHTTPQHAGQRNAWTIPGLLRIAARQDPTNLNILLGTKTVDTDISMFWAAYLFH